MFEAARRLASRHYAGFRLVMPCVRHIDGRLMAGNVDLTVTDPDGARYTRVAQSLDLLRLRTVT